LKAGGKVILAGNSAASSLIMEDDGNDSRLSASANDLELFWSRPDGGLQVLDIGGTNSSGDIIYVSFSGHTTNELADFQDTNIQTTGNITIDSDTSALILGDDQDIKLYSNALANLSISAGTGATDITLSFVGTNTGQIQWKHSLDYFLFLDDLWMGGPSNIMIQSTGKLNFRDTDIGLASWSDAILDIFADDCVRIGDGSAELATNYTRFASNGLQTMVGTARVLRDLWIDTAGIKAPGSKPATEVSHGNLENAAWQFSDEGVEANQETVSWRVAPPYDMDRNEEVKIRIGWSSASTGNVKWQLEYRWLSEDEDTTQGAEETLTAIGGASATANGLVVTDITGINAPSSNDASIIFRLTRLSADGQDTISDDVELHGVCFTYTSDKLGEAL